MHRDPVTLASLAEHSGGSIVGRGDIIIDDVVHDSRDSVPGSIFVAVRGFTSDGHDFVGQAIERGTSAICVDRPMAVDIPQLIVTNTRQALPVIAAEVHGHPSRRLQVVGITGTNGKTTVTYFLEAIALAAGKQPGLIGTIGARIGTHPIELARTTPEATDLQRLLGRMDEAGVDIVAMEVSSHALELGRVDGVWFSVVGFTNLSQDHLDFHGDMEGYYQAKAKLFVPDRAAEAVIWVDDEAGARLSSECALPVSEVGSATPIRAEGVELTPAGSRFVLVTPEGSAAVKMNLGGRFNVDNAVIAAACAHRLGFDLSSITSGLEAASIVPGRYEIVETDRPFTVIVDYAHTPDGVANVVETTRDLSTGRIIVVLGAGGDRDRTKRPAMGAAAGRADVFYLTSDNPRSEDPMDIISAVRNGAETGQADLIVEPDRAAAIHQAIAAARPGDIVLILGKGHETGQEIGGIIHDFDDHVVARRALERGVRC